MYFWYDDTGFYAFTYNDGVTEETYYYVKNWQGDIVGLPDSDSELVLRYKYTAWGTCSIWYAATMDRTIGKANPMDITTIQIPGCITCRRDTTILLSEDF